jgi:hypothetical protein
VYTLYHLSKAIGVLPTSFLIDPRHLDVQRDEVMEYGGFSDVYKGTYGVQAVAVKEIRLLAERKVRSVYHRVAKY